MKKPIKIGFDLDGVILYNPFRLTRPLVSLLKAPFAKKKDGIHFYYPQTKIEQFFWRICHKSSFFVAPGFEDLKSLAREKKIKAYIITARYSFLKNDFEKWLKSIHADEYFDFCFYNKDDHQPHVFKEKMIKKLKLDIFVEDNLDIVEYLNTHTKTKILWIYNVLDRSVSYPHKFPGLKQAIEFLRK